MEQCGQNETPNPLTHEKTLESEGNKVEEKPVDSEGTQPVESLQSITNMGNERANKDAPPLDSPTNISQLEDLVNNNSGKKRILGREIQSIQVSSNEDVDQCGASACVRDKAATIDGNTKPCAFPKHDEAQQELIELREKIQLLEKQNLQKTLLQPSPSPNSQRRRGTAFGLGSVSKSAKQEMVEVKEASLKLEDDNRDLKLQISELRKVMAGTLAKRYEGDLADLEVEQLQVKLRQTEEAKARLEMEAAEEASNIFKNPAASAGSGDADSNIQHACGEQERNELREKLRLPEIQKAKNDVVLQPTASPSSHTQRGTMFGRANISKPAQQEIADLK
eukprot:Platyproteum_vivax@DN7330_c1_g2_i1.p1